MIRALLVAAILTLTYQPPIAAQAAENDSAGSDAWALPHIGWIPGTIGMIGIEYDRMVGRLAAGALLQGGHGAVGLGSLLYGDLRKPTFVGLGLAAGYRYFDSYEHEWLAGLRVVVDLPVRDRRALRFDVAIFPTVEEGEALFGVGYVFR